MSLTELKAWELCEGYRNRDFSCREVTEEYLRTIEEKDGDINAYISVTSDLALKSADEVDKKLNNREELTPLAGVPISIKDNIALKDVRLTCSSKFLENYVSPFDSTISENLKKNNAVILGKTNLDEFAMGASTKTSYFGVTKNPLDTKRVSGGSSGGSAASVAAEEACVSIGTDTGGSVRQPSSFCGLVGMKPTYGSISRYGMSTMANTFDQAGVIAKDVKDVAITLRTLEGRDKKDATSVGNPGLNFDFNFDDVKNNLKGIKFAIPQIYLEMETDPEVKKNFENAIEILKENGAEIISLKMDSLKYVIETYHILANGEIAPNMARFDSVLYGHRTDDYKDIEEMYRKSRAEGFGDEVKRRIMIGTHILSLDLASEYYYKALEVRGLIKSQMDEMFKTADIMLCPTVPVLPFEIDRDMSPIEVYQSDLFTIPASMVGAPSISIPMKKNSDGLSVGIEFTANRFKDRELIKAALGFERSLI